MSAAVKKVFRCKTVHLKKAFDPVLADDLYNRLKDVQWTNGIPSKVHGFTRRALPINLNGYNEKISQTLVDEIKVWIITALEVLKDEFQKAGIQGYALLGTYLNYYVDGTHFTPNHNHPGQHQIVISLGTTRTLEIGKKKYIMESGDIVLFGTSIHGVPKELDVKEGRISIATFMIPY